MSRVDFNRLGIRGHEPWCYATTGRTFRLLTTSCALTLVCMYLIGCGTQPRGGASVDATVKAEVERLATVVPSQSHAMVDVGFHWTNLWFAGQAGNWPLAKFYFDEARSHIMWTVRIRPIRQDLDGRDVDLKSIFEAVDASTLAAVKIAIERQDSGQFAVAYRGALEGCYSCHKSSGKPYLRPTGPSAPAQTVIAFDPDDGDAAGEGKPSR
jgi:hypothetical protein